MKFYPYISDRFIILMRRTIIIMKDFIGHILLFISAVVYIVVQAWKFGGRYQNSNRIVLGTILFS